MAQKAYLLSFGGEAVGEEFYGDVQALTVDESTTAATILQLRLATRLLEDGRWTYLEQDRFAPFTTVAAAIGFTEGAGLAGALGALGSASGNAGLDPVFNGYVTAVNVTLGSQPGQTFIDIT